MFPMWSFIFLYASHGVQQQETAAVSGHVGTIASEADTSSHVRVDTLLDVNSSELVLDNPPGVPMKEADNASVELRGYVKSDEAPMKEADDAFVELRGYVKSGEAEEGDNVVVPISGHIDAGVHFRIWIVVGILIVAALAVTHSAVHTQKFWINCAIVSFYVGSYIGYSTLLSARKDDINIMSSIYGAAVIKLVFSLVAFFIVDGSIFVMMDSIKKEWKVTLYYTAPAFLFLTSDLMNAYCLKNMDTSLFNTLYRIRIVAMALLWQYAFNGNLGRNHWMGLFCIFGGCVLAQAHALPLSSPSSIVLGALAISIVASIFSAVYNEKLLKEKEMSINLQNAILYIYSICCIGIGNMINHPHSRSSLSDCLTYPMNVLVILFAIYGLVNAFFLKYMDSVTRELGSATIVIVSLVIDAHFFGVDLGYQQVLGGTAVVAGILLYNGIHEICIRKSTQSENDGEEDTAAENLNKDSKESNP